MDNQLNMKTVIKIRHLECNFCYTYKCICTFQLYFRNFIASLSSCSDISDIYIIVQLCLSIMKRKINMSTFKFIRSQVIHEKLGYFAVQRVNWQLR